MKTPLFLIRKGPYLSRHNILFLGLRGQAKTRMARQMIDLLDEYIPVVEGSEINDDPMAPISTYAKRLIAEKGDDTPIALDAPQRTIWRKTGHT